MFHKQVSKNSYTNSDTTICKTVESTLEQECMLNSKSCAFHLTWKFSNYIRVTQVVTHFQDFNFKASINNLIFPRVLTIVLHRSGSCSSPLEPQGRGVRITRSPPDLKTSGGDLAVRIPRPCDS